MITLNSFTQKVQEVIKRAREETISCPEDHCPVNLTLDYITEDLADYLELVEHPPMDRNPPITRRQFLANCGFQSW